MSNLFCEKLFSELSPEERILKFKSAVVKDKCLTVDFLIQKEDYNKFINDTYKSKVKNIINGILPHEIRCKINYDISDPTKENIIKKINEYIYNEHKSVYTNFSNADYIVDFDDVINITIKMEKYICDYAKGINLEQKIADYLGTQFYEDSEIAFAEIPNKEFVEAEFFVPRSSDIRIIEAKPLKIYKNGSLLYPRYITDIIKSEQEISNLTLCGIISNINTRKIIKENAKVKEIELFTFLLNDTTDRIKCKFFARPKKDFVWSDVIADNEPLIMNGSYTYDKFDNRFCFLVNSIASADINFNSINLTSDFNKDYGKYIRILPEPYSDVEQNDLFDIAETDSEPIDGNYCCFDLETTGLSIESDEIIEIAAIKIINGKFTEKFSTFVKPDVSIPNRITEITGITDEMVKDAPKISEVIPDFYRFSKDCVLVGHNILSYDVPLLNAQSFKCKYKFDNICEDTLVLSKQKLKLSRYKLGDVCNACSVPLNGAHRAINDVAANAKLFLKLKKL